MTGLFFVQLIVAVVVLCVALWAIAKLAQPDVAYILRVVAIAAFLIWLVLRALPILGIT